MVTNGTGNNSDDINDIISFNDVLGSGGPVKQAEPSRKIKFTIESFKRFKQGVAKFFEKYYRKKLKNAEEQYAKIYDKTKSSLENVKENNSDRVSSLIARESISLLADRKIRIINIEHKLRRLKSFGSNPVKIPGGFIRKIRENVSDYLETRKDKKTINRTSNEIADSIRNGNYKGALNSFNSKIPFSVVDVPAHVEVPEQQSSVDENVFGNGGFAIPAVETEGNPWDYLQNDGSVPITGVQAGVDGPESIFEAVGQNGHPTDGVAAESSPAALFNAAAEIARERDRVGADAQIFAGDTLGSNGVPSTDATGVQNDGMEGVAQPNLGIGGSYYPYAGYSDITGPTSVDPNGFQSYKVGHPADGEPARREDDNAAAQIFEGDTLGSNGVPSTNESSEPFSAPQFDAIGVNGDAQPNLGIGGSYQLYEGYSDTTGQTSLGGQGTGESSSMNNGVDVIAASGADTIVQQSESQSPQSKLDSKIDRMNSKISRLNTEIKQIEDAIALLRNGNMDDAIQALENSKNERITQIENLEKSIKLLKKVHVRRTPKFSNLDKQVIHFLQNCRFHPKSFHMATEKFGITSDEVYNIYRKYCDYVSFRVAKENSAEQVGKTK